MVKIGTEIASPQTGERLVFRSTADSSGGRLFQAEVSIQPGPYVARSHVHRSQEESFVILAGSFGYRIGHRRGVASVGETLVCPVGVPHSQWNAGDDVLRVYYEHRPALRSAEVFFETFFGLSREGKLTPSGQMSTLQAIVLIEEVSDFIRPSSPPVAVQQLLFPPLAALGRRRGYRARYERFVLPEA